MQHYQKFTNLFFHTQATSYRGRYDMDMGPYLTDDGKLKYKPPKDSGLRSNYYHYKGKLTDTCFHQHLVINKYGNDEDLKTVQIGKFNILKYMDVGLVLSPLGEDGLVKWGAVDIDVYQNQEEIKRIIKYIYDNKLPLIPCYSKSGGLHLYLFCKEPFTYAEITKVLKYYVNQLNITQKRKLEIFPKQAKEKGKVGNGIALPYRSTIIYQHKDNVLKYDAFPNPNVLAKEDGSLGNLYSFVVAAENNLIEKTVFENMPIQDIKEKEVKPETPLKEEKILVPDIEGSIRQPSKNAKKIIDNIKKGEEHEDGGTFDNWIVDLVYCCVVHDKSSNIEINEYFEKIKHRSDKSEETDYLKHKIDNCRKKYNKPDPGPQITKFFLNTVWDCEFDKYYDLEKNKHRSDRSLNQINSKLFSEKTTPAAEFYKHENKQIVDACLYRPDLHDPNNRIIKDGNMTYINKYIPCNLEALKPTEADLKPFFDLLDYLFPNKKEQKHILDWLAHVVQYPGVKIRHSILVYSKDWQVGKGSLFDLMTDILGEDNCEPGNVKSILDKGVTFSEKCLVLIDECSSTGDFKEKRNLVNDLKTIISEKRIQKRLLYVDYGAAKNFANFLIFTNNPDALTIDAKDPRYFVVDHYENRLDQKFYNKYHEWRTNNGAKFVKWYLINRDLSKFNNMAPPPVTDAKSRMAEQTQNPLLSAMKTAFDEGKMPFPFNHSIRGTTEISEWYQKFGSGKVKKFADNPKEIKRCFEILGFHELGQVKHKLRDEKPSLWIIRNIKSLLETYKASELCNHKWIPLQMINNDEAKEQTAMKNLNEKINSVENSIRTKESLRNHQVQNENAAATNIPDRQPLGAGDGLHYGYGDE